MNIHYQDDSVTLWHGDSLEVLRTLPDQSVNCCVTSPPYYGLRDYGSDGQFDLSAEYLDLSLRTRLAQTALMIEEDAS